LLLLLLLLLLVVVVVCAVCAWPGFAINNTNDAAEDAMGAGDCVRGPVPSTHYARTVIGQNGTR